MTTLIFRKTLTGKESSEQLNDIIDKYLNPEKIKDLRFVFVLRRNGEKTKKVDCYQSGGKWVRVNYIGRKCLSTRETSFEDLIARTKRTMELPEKLIYVAKISLTVYGNNE